MFTFVLFMKIFSINYNKRTTELRTKIIHSHAVGINENDPFSKYLPELRPRSSLFLK